MLRVLPVVCSSTYESKLFSAICVLTFCAFLRIGEVVDSGNANHVLQRHDIILNQHDKSVSVTINSSKTDQYGNKTNLVVTNGHTGVLVFDVMQQYMAMRPNINGALFCHLNHLKVTRHQVSKILKSALRFLGYKEDEFNTHSFRIGAATNAAEQGLADDVIMRMGRWKSDSFRRYIRIKTVL